MSQRCRKERERFVFMLLVTEVFLAPPTHKETGGMEGMLIKTGRDLQKEKYERSWEQMRGAAGGKC